MGLRLHALRPVARPVRGNRRFRESFPADYICEALDQTRGWFYSLLAVSTLLFGRSSYKTVLCLGLILDPEGQKMSKSRGNVVVPWDVLDAHGADALRWYYFTAKQPWDGYRFSLDTVGESVRQFLKTLWSTYGFLVLYANASDSESGGRDRPRPLVLSRLAATVERVTDRLENYDTVRRSRDRRLRRRPVQLVRAALAPAVLGRRRDRLRHPPRVPRDHGEAARPAHPVRSGRDLRQPRRERASVHLCDFPRPGERDTELEWQMQVARSAVELGRAARSHAKLKLRQPLREAVVVAADRERSAIERFEALVLEELNVKSVRYVSEADELGRFEIKPNYRTLGPRFGKQMPQVTAAVAALDATKLRSGGRVGVNIGGQEHKIGPEDVQVVLQPLAGYRVERSGTHAVALDVELDDELRREALAREVVHAVQAARKTAGLRVEDRIALKLGGHEELLAAARAHEDYVARETLAVALAYDGAERGRAHEGRRPRVDRDGRAQVGSGGDAAPARLRGQPADRPDHRRGRRAGRVRAADRLRPRLERGAVSDHGRPDQDRRRLLRRHGAPRRRRRARSWFDRRARVRQLHLARPRDRRRRAESRAARPEFVLVFITSIFGGILGLLGGRFRAGATPAPPGRRPSARPRAPARSPARADSSAGRR